MLITRSHSRVWLAALFAAMALVVAACSSAPPPAPAAVEVPTDVPAPVEPPTAAPVEPATMAPESDAPTEVYTLGVATGTMGNYLTDEDGKTLYTFKKDTANSGTSACTGECADKWPPFLLGVLAADETLVGGEGATGIIASITRDDGKLQATYNGMPLYYYATDLKAGDTGGQGVGDVWYVAAP